MSLATSPLAPARPGAVLEPLVAAVGDATLMRRATTALARQGIEVLAVVAGPDELETLADARHPHVVLLASVDAREDAANIRALAAMLPHSRVIIALRSHQASAVRGALRAGADGVVLEHQLALSLPAVVRAVALGHAVVPLQDRSALGREPLSAREREVLALAAGGLTNAAIAARLHLSESTVKSHVSSGFSKLGLHSRSELDVLIREGRGRRGTASRTTDLTGGTA
jgi:two-component system response regulator DesR